MAKKNIKIQIDTEDLRRVQWALRGIQDGAPKALRGAVNKTLTGAKTDMTKETAKILTVKQKRIRQDIEVTKKATLSDLSGVVSTEGKPLNLVEFQSTQLKKGIKTRVLKSEPKKLIRGAFFATVSGNKLVFRRRKVGEGSHKIGTKKRKSWMAYGALPEHYRLPIEALTGPRIQDITSRDDVMAKIQASSRERMNKELSRQVDRLLAKQKVK